MTMKVFIRDWFNINADVDNGIELNAFDMFVYNNEPAGVADDVWRKELEEMLEFVIEEYS